MRHQKCLEASPRTLVDFQQNELNKRATRSLKGLRLSAHVLNVGVQLRDRLIRPLPAKQPNLLISGLRQARSYHGSCSSPYCYTNSASSPSQEQPMVSEATASSSNPSNGVQGDLSLWM